MIGRRGEAWNDGDISVLRSMAKDGEALTAIARRLERTREAVYTKARSLKIEIKSL